MKIVFSSTGKNWSDKMDERFGRAKGFILYNDETKCITWHSNEENLNAAHGAGTQAAQFVISAEASVVITGQVGPKAFDLLNTAGVKIYNAKVDSIKEIYNAYMQGKLQQQK